MKLGLALGGILGVLALTGPAVMQAPAEPLAASPPAWLELQNQDAIAAVEWTGATGLESTRGNVILSFAGDGEKEMEWLRNRFVTEGYIVSPVNRGLDNIMGSADVADANDPVTGRRVVMTRVEKPVRSLLVLSFTDPRAGM
jgi:hypothetical protein